MKKIIDKIKMWSLHNRVEMIWFAIGFILGAIIG